MRTIWAESYLVINLCADYLILLLASRLCGVPLHRARYALGALLGALAALLGLITGAPGLISPQGRLLTALAICACAWAPRREFWRLCAAFFALSAALGGAVWALGEQAGMAAPSLALLCVSFLFFYLLFALLLRRSAAGREREILPVTLVFLGRSASFRALRDTGNALCDPVSGYPVMVVAPAALKGVFAELAPLFSLSDPTELLRCAAEIEPLRGRLRLVPYAAVGARGLLAAFHPDSLSVNGRENRELLVALSPSAAGDGFDALL